MSLKTAKMLQFINYRMKVNVAENNRVLVGTFLAYDKYMNIVLADCQEYRKIKRKRGSAAGDVEEREEVRSLGLVLLRGESVVSIQVEAPPKKRAKTSAQQGGGAGRGIQVGRGEGLVAAAPPMHAVGGFPGGLQAPAHLPGMGSGAPPPSLPMSMGRGRRV